MHSIVDLMVLYESCCLWKSLNLSSTLLLNAELAFPAKSNFTRFWIDIEFVLPSVTIYTARTKNGKNIQAKYT